MFEERLELRVVMDSLAPKKFFLHSSRASVPVGLDKCSLDCFKRLEWTCATWLPRLLATETRTADSTAENALFRQGPPITPSKYYPWPRVAPRKTRLMGRVVVANQLPNFTGVFPRHIPARLFHYLFSSASSRLRWKCRLR